VRRDPCREGKPLRIHRDHPVLQVRAFADGAAAETGDPVEPAVEIDDAAAARALVQAVDVLRDQDAAAFATLQFSKREMDPIGPRGGDEWPADHAACPVTLPRGFAAGEDLEGHRRRALPLALEVPIVRYPGVGADAC